MVILSTIGGCAGLLVVTLTFVLAFGTDSPRKPPSAQKGARTNAQKTTGRTTSPPTPMVTASPQAEKEDESLAALFNEPIEYLTPKVLVPALKQGQLSPVELRVPNLSLWRRARDLKRKGVFATPARKQVRLSLDQIKKAVTFIKLQGPNPATGSGFLIAAEGDHAWVATNAHVVADAVLPVLRDPSHVPQVRVIFDSGLLTESGMNGEVVGYDSQADLAVIRVRKFPRLPQPIDPRSMPRLMETLGVLICGFPFGEALATGTRHPAVTINKGAVSSIRRDARGEVTMVQIDGSINPGNSGGPVVTSDGQLVGIAAVTIKGAGIGMAVPASELTAMLEGRVSTPLFLGEGIEGGVARFDVLVQTIDPMNKIREVSLHLLTDGSTRYDRDEAGLYVPMKGSKKIVLERTGRLLAGANLRLPGSAGSRFTAQLVCTYASGEVVASIPVAYQITHNAVQKAIDAVPLSTIDQAPAKHTGKVVVVRGHLNPVAQRQGDYFRVEMTDEKNENPQQLEFLTTEEIKSQLGEIPVLGRALPVQVTCRIGKQRVGKFYPVRVVRIDFLGREDRVLATIPATEEEDEALMALNRNPARFVGQTQTVLALVSPRALALESKDQWEFQVRLPNGGLVQNLCIIAPTRMANKLHAEGLQGGGYLARLTVRVEKHQVKTRHAVALLKVEWLDREGQVLGTIE